MTSATERASLLLEGAVRRSARIVSPEGVALNVEVASYGDRVGAFLLDFLFWNAAAFVIVLVTLLIFGSAGRHREILSVAVFLAFLVSNLYMIHFELFWRGATPGKRIMAIRVIDRQGGPLLPGAVIARNLTRNISQHAASVPLMNRVGYHGLITTAHR